MAEETKKRAKEIGNQPAFPDSTDAGMTKREQLAAMAMQGLLANPHLGNHPLKDIAISSFQYADALLIALAESEVNNG